MSFRPNLAETYVQRDGHLTLEGLKLLQDMNSRITDLETKLAAIAAVAAPTGGATTDAEARAAINSIITAAG